MSYKRILLKLSGEALMGDDKETGIDSKKLLHYAQEIKKIYDIGIQISIVIGGGNIYRGFNNTEHKIDRVQGDYMGMLATLINGLALQNTLENIGISTRLQSAINVNQVAEPYIKRKAVRHLEKNRIVIFAAGTGNPYFTTDSAAVLRAIETEADVILKGTKVDGVYNCDPKTNSNAIKYEEITFNEAISKGLKIMDSTAFTLSQENNLPIIVFDINLKDNLIKAVSKEKIGTIVNIK
tara:strand:+ start:193 stop:906 length:714 start_codon:yes stop_codon:yes gene_type:complete